MLRGINVGSHKQVKMEVLRKVFESLGFSHVKTFLNSGNVVFETERSDPGVLKTKIEEVLKKEFGFEISVLVRSMDEIRKLVESAPFKEVVVTPQTRLYVTFLSDKPKSKLKIPYESPERDFKILRISENEVCSVIAVSSNRNTTDLMSMIEKEFGKAVTTRNWNTVTKLSNLE